MLDANHGFDAIEAIALGRRVASLEIVGLRSPSFPTTLPPTSKCAVASRSRRLAEGANSRAGAFAKCTPGEPLTCCSPTRVPPVAFRSARTLPTWRRRSACATCRTYGAAASTLRPPAHRAPPHALKRHLKTGPEATSLLFASCRNGVFALKHVNLAHGFPYLVAHTIDATAQAYHREFEGVATGVHSLEMQRWRK